MRAAESWRIGRSALLAAVAVAWLGGGAPAQDAEIERLIVTPRDGIIAPGERLTLEAWATVRGSDQNQRVPCRWRLLASRGQARLAVGKGPTVAAVIEAGVAPAFVVVEAQHVDGDGLAHTAKTTVLCSRPVLVAPSRIAVGEPAPCELTLPLLPATRTARVSIDVLEEPEGADTRFVRMTDGELGPVGGDYAVKMPVVGGSLQVGIRVQAPGRYTIQGRVIVDAYELRTEPLVILAMPIARVALAAYRSGPPEDPTDLIAGPGGHGVPGPYVLEPPQGLAPVVLAFGPGGEPLGICSPATAPVGRYLTVRGQERLVPARFPLGVWFVDAKAPTQPAPGTAVRLPIAVHRLGTALRRDASIKALLTVCEVRPVAVVPLPVGAAVRLGIAFEGAPGAVQIVPLDGRSAYPLGAESKTCVRVEPQSAVDAVITGLVPGLAQIRHRCGLKDETGGETRLRMASEVLVVGPDDAVLCDRRGRPVANAAAAAWVVAGAGRHLPDGKGGGTLRLPAGVTPTGPPQPLQRDGGVCWIAPLRSESAK